MVYTALGDAIVRLSAPAATGDSLRWCLDSGTPMLADGALRAVAMQAGPRSDVAGAAASSLQGKYQTYSPL